MKTMLSGSRGRLLGVLAACTSACGLLLAQGLIRVYDQTNAPDPLPPDNYDSIDVRTNAPLGQLFVPALDRIDFVELLLGETERPAGETTQSLQVNLRAGTITGPVLASTAPAALVWEAPRNRFVQEFVFRTPVSVTPGDAYAFEVVHVSGGDLFRTVYLTSYGTGTGEPDYYVPGGWFRKGVFYYVPDLWFREGVIIPEPATAVLLACGTLVLALSFRRRP